MKVDVPLLDKLRYWLRRLGPASGGIVVAVSGGPDSVALLRGLTGRHPGPLVVAHLNHQLRGAESDDDEEFVRQLYATLQAQGSAALQLRTERIAVGAQARAERGNLESVARRIRYDWLLQVARATNCRWIATGHTADDQAETVLFRPLRGTGLHGLRGIAARRELAPGIAVVRPLLAVPRSEVMAYLDAEQQPYRIDSSNADGHFTRNRIRQELLPLLQDHYNPAIASVLCRLAAQAEDVTHQVEAESAALLAAVERPRAGAVIVFDRLQLATVPAYRVREMFRLVWVREGWPRGEMTFAAWDRLAAVAQGEVVGVDLPGGVRVRTRERVVQLERVC